MNLTQFSDFTHNIALLLSLGLLYDMVISNKRRKHYITQKTITGLVLTFIGIILMSTPWEFSPGYFFDPRTVLMSISGLFFGYIPTGIGVTFLIIFRIYQGGGGVIPGILWILISASSGLLWKKIRPYKNKPYSFWELFIFGIIIHIAALLTLFTLPLPTALSILSNVTLPILLFFPLGTAILGLVLSDRKERKKAEIQVTRLATVIEQLNEKVIITDLDGYPQYLNHYFETSTGYTISEIIGQKLGNLKSGYHEKIFYDDLW
ncbi:MAG: PAS domain S-box protein, partial [Spirochaetaceae bacterium]|nr:PAS domain S-box protein [Spirochaetaceae bacterium]